MAYQNVGTPRFYIDWGEYQKSSGTLEIGKSDIVEWDNTFISNIEETKELTGLSPEIPIMLPAQNTLNKFTMTFSSGTQNGYDYESFPNYIAILNHNFATSSVLPILHSSGNGTSSYTLDKGSEIINYNNENYPFPNSGDKDGFSITEIANNVNPSGSKYIQILLMPQNNSAEVDTPYLKDIYIGAISFGRFYDMPVSPDLDLSMSIEYDGFTNIKTLSGHTITQANYQGSPWWYDVDGNKVEPWSVGGSTTISKRNGRRVWKLKFSYMSDKDLFASNYGSSTYGEQDNFTEIGYDGGDVDAMNWGQDIITNGTFTDNVDDGWSHRNVGEIVGESITHDASNGVGDSGCCKITVKSDDYIAIRTSAVIFENGKTYKISMYAKAGDNDGRQFRTVSHSDANNDPALYNDGESVRTLTTTLQKFEWEFTADADSDYLYIARHGDGAPDADEDWVFFIDNVEVFVSNPTDFYYTIDNDDSFSAQVLNKVSHGEKFIFQPDNTSNNPSDFAICVLDGDSFSMKRTAFNVYDIEMTIKEVW